METTESSLQRKLFAEARVLKLISCAEYSLTSDPLVTDSIKTLANLSDDISFGHLISTHSTLESIIKSISGTDSITNWEIESCSEFGGLLLLLF